MNLLRLKIIGSRILYRLNDGRYKKLRPRLVSECISNIEKWRLEEGNVQSIQGINLNAITNPSNWENDEWIECLKDIGQPIDIMHRKAWEFAQTLYGLKKLGMIQENKTALGVACGHEPLIFYLANKIAMVYATDIYSGGFYQKSGDEADPSMLTSPEKFSPFPFRKDHLKVMRMDAKNLQFNDETFDFAFCLSSIEHFGKYAERLKALREIARVLKKCGIAAITTELILSNGNSRGYFTYGELKRLIADSGMELVGGISFDIDKKWFDKVSMSPLEIHLTPHFILQQKKIIFTSVMVFLKKVNLRI